MTKMKTEKIKQSLLWKDDKWAVCGRQVEVNFFFFNPWFLWHNATNVCVRPA